jgi:hypothetical protein
MGAMVLFERHCWQAIESYKKKWADCRRGRVCREPETLYIIVPHERQRFSPVDAPGLYFLTYTVSLKPTEFKTNNFT